MKKKIWLGIIYGVLAAIIVAVVVLACVPAGFKPELANPDTITIQRTSDILPGYNKDQNVYKTVMEKFNNSFKENCLSAFFTGKLDSKYNTSLVSSSTTFTAPYIEFKYAEAQTLMENGKAVKKATKDENIVYKSVIIPISEKNAVEKVTMYVKYVNADTTTIYSIKAYANFSALYDYISEL